MGQTSKDNVCATLISTGIPFMRFLLVRVFRNRASKQAGSSEFQ